MGELTLFLNLEGSINHSDFFTSASLDERWRREDEIYKPKEALSYSLGGGTTYRFNNEHALTADLHLNSFASSFDPSGGIGWHFSTNRAFTFLEYRTRSYSPITFSQDEAHHLTLKQRDHTVGLQGGAFIFNSLWVSIGTFLGYSESTIAGYGIIADSPIPLHFEGESPGVGIGFRLALTFPVTDWLSIYTSGLLQLSTSVVDFNLHTEAGTVYDQNLNEARYLTRVALGVAIISPSITF